MATNAVLRLQKILIEKGHGVVRTSVFNQNCLESLFGVVRLKQRRPTPLQFKSHLRTIAISQYMQPIKNSSYEMDDHQYLTGFMEYLKAAKIDEFKCSSTKPKNVPSLSNLDIPSAAEVLLSSKSVSEAIAIYHISGYIMGSIKKTSNTCIRCMNQCVSAVPFDQTYGRYSTFLARVRHKAFMFVTRTIFYFFVCMEEEINRYIKKHRQLTKGDMIALQSSLESLRLEIPNCHNLKMKMVKRFIRFKACSNRSKKTRKRRYDSRSMLN